ncbi:Alpha/Beta hydrolase fold [Arabidopsis thaliana x Arabidopsis arenosa]|uniref:Alpha/Beta hydrolase fold n=1 Tax=Arabidopsis thaliana x Arabidopsis arenosa TaxID=1240361 RepID=A0A8T2GPT7_9BRAS|nr:Alpha/Beta hydrolase fold [Arabidopsis thaliana x Arabidopsis arenosa]
MASGLFSFQKSMASGSTRAKVTAEFHSKKKVTTEFGDTVTVTPRARHQATIVWLHDLNESGYDSSELVKSFSLYNVKWICPSSPLISNVGFGGAPARACKISLLQNFKEEHAISIHRGFKVNEFSSRMPDPYEMEGLKNSAAHVAGLLKNEPENVMKGVAGYGIGGALALHIATCYALGSFPIQIRAVVGINCWLPNRFIPFVGLAVSHRRLSFCRCRILVFE